MFAHIGAAFRFVYPSAALPTQMPFVDAERSTGKTWLDKLQTSKEPLEVPSRTPCRDLHTAESPTVAPIGCAFFRLVEPSIAGLSDDSAASPFHRSHASLARVLIVDDDPSVTETFARMLTLEGYDVRTALDAEAALREAEASHLDAILLDLRMPIVDGLAFLRQLRAREDQRQTPVAIVTGDYFVDDVVSDDLRGLGAELHFKPLWLEDLVRITQTLLTRHPPVSVRQ
jgi:CheY-like chemotaxis protein